MSDLCRDPDNVLCEGFNGLKSLITPFLPGAGDATSTTSSTSATTTSVLSTTNAPAAPPPPPTPQPVVQPSTTAENMTSISVALTEVSNPQSFITILPTSFTSIPGSLPTSTSTDIEQPTQTSTSANAETTQPVVAQAQSFPTALVVGLSVTVALLVISGIVLWYFCLRKRLRNSAGFDYGEGASVNEIYRTTEITRSTDKADSSASTMRANVVYGTQSSTLQWAQQSRPESWQPKAPSIHTLTESRHSFDETDSNFPEPLSPRPVMQQTLQRVSVPRPVEASSFKSGSREDSFGGSSDTSNTYSVRQVVVKGPAPGVAHGRPSSSSTQTRVMLNLAKVPGEGSVDLRTVTARKPVASHAQSITSATSLEVPVGIMPEELDSSKSGQANGLRRQYTVRRSPLAQNPFTDPSDEEWQVQSRAEESIKSPTLRIVNPDIPQETQSEEVIEKLRAGETEKQGSENEKHQSHGREADLQEERAEDEKLEPQPAPSTDRVASTPPVIPMIPEQRYSFSPSVKRVSFANNA